MMASIYQKLNKKLDALQEHKSHGKNNNETMKQTVHTRLQNVTQMKLSCEQINTSNFGFDFAIEKDPKQFINTFIIDTECGIRHLDIKIENTCRYLIIIISNLSNDRSKASYKMVPPHSAI